MNFPPPEPSNQQTMAHIALENTHKLVTHEDPYHFHKALGILSFAHYVYRIGYWMATRGETMGFDSTPPNTQLAFILIHTLLSTSSLIFRIPANRIRGKPMIYREFRIHSILFASRSFAVMFVIWCDPPQMVTRLLTAAIVLATIVVADFVTNHYKKTDPTQGSTMRDMPFPKEVSHAMRDRINLYYSVSQVAATLNMLYFDSPDRPFLVAFPIQMAAFLMTLVRKSIISGATWHILYASFIGINYIYGTTGMRSGPASTDTPIYLISLTAFCIARFAFHTNKYVLWLTIVFVHIMR